MSMRLYTGLPMNVSVEVQDMVLLYCDTDTGRCVIMNGESVQRAVVYACKEIGAGREPDVAEFERLLPPTYQGIRP